MSDLGCWSAPLQPTAEIMICTLFPTLVVALKQRMLMVAAKGTNDVLALRVSFPRAWTEIYIT
jgi:hypothetical protein